MRSSQIEVYSNNETKQCIAISQQFDIIDFFCVTHAPTSYKPLINNELKNPCSPSKNFPAMVCLPILRTMKQWPLAKEWQPLDEIRLDRP